MGKKSRKKKTKRRDAPNDESTSDSATASTKGGEDNASPLVSVKFSWIPFFTGNNGRVNDPNCGPLSPRIKPTENHVKLEDFDRAMSDYQFRHVLVTSLIRKNAKLVLQDYNFWCCICDNMATDFHVNRGDLLDRTPPQVLATMAYPICDNKGCKLTASQRMEGVLASLEKEDGMTGIYSQSPRECGTCGTTSVHEMQICSRCKATYYCNRECQLKAWLEHKKCCVAPDSSQTSSSEGGGGSARQRHEPYA